jgi:hypothetical protein
VYFLLSYADESKQPRAGLRVGDQVLDMEGALTASGAAKNLIAASRSTLDILNVWPEAELSAPLQTTPTI